MEPIIVIVGFLGAGKTTLLQRLIKEYLAAEWKPFIVLNDYQNAQLDAQRMAEFIDQSQIEALSGSCICCTGITELRKQLNDIPVRQKGVTLVEANGTTDACSLMEFLGVGLKEHFHPPIQIAVVDTKNWQKRGFHNDLEANQVQAASLILLNHLDDVGEQRIEEVKESLRALNPYAIVKLWGELDPSELVDLMPTENKAQPMDHAKAHWASCSVDLPDPIGTEHLIKVLEGLPETILRVKGCTRIDNEENYSYFEKTPVGDTVVSPYRGKLVSGPKLLVVGPGSDPQALAGLIADSRC